jgi:predicted nucleic acid-binding protein
MITTRAKVFADTNVLASAALRDILIELALDGLIALHWSPFVMVELRRVLASRKGAVIANVDRMLDAMATTLPGASVTPAISRPIIATLPDPNDMPILLGALSAECSILLTFNLKDFPAVQLRVESVSLRPMHPDAFVVHMLTTHAPAVIAIIKRILANLTRNPLSVDAYTANLARTGLPNSAMLLQALLK